ncbi:hypothetical protein [Bacillus thuringiensis]|uniref:hypothetical protein n=1 Tax=Bacillus thuringiensis TaxID=1428 RepID=UPI0021D68800|nr:hypothetical protein [Bacillus thuringiensis]MCU7667168.1 hypothetical protein [Bacillus thuringiensis]
MKVYVGFQNVTNETFQNLIFKSEVLKKHQFIFGENVADEKDWLQKCEVMIADVSYPTIPLGIEMGWADNYKVDIICVCVKGTAISSHLTRMCKEILIYTEVVDLVEKLERLFETQYNRNKRANK